MKNPKTRVTPTEQARHGEACHRRGHTAWLPGPGVERWEAQTLCIKSRNADLAVEISLYVPQRKDTSNPAYCVTRV
eukprot:5911668-Pyramimonas_sp.AAC.1